MDTIQQWNLSGSTNLQLEAKALYAFFKQYSRLCTLPSSNTQGFVRFLRAILEAVWAHVNGHVSDDGE
ncbi:hypothetical protein AMTR_s00045p00031540 [Amborella trichopoda]|uniref:Uncharacterized protein n=1 Tax=Amborella trichopoda TaxID=13333 RepID=W1P2P6_AMBTC|nr:hypothetical protein AMTR_s00045p00031540 [Amborella trichopoda]